MNQLRITLCLLLGSVTTVAAQIARDPGAQTSRVELEAAIARAESVLASPGYSSRIKTAKRRELALYRSRLTEGDLGPGDQVILAVDNERDLTGTFVVGPARTLALPGIGDLPLRGLLRSEVDAFLEAELRKYLKDPKVHVQTTLRLSVLGAVGRPGYYQVSSSLMLADAIMASGGPATGIDPAATRIERQGSELFSREAVAQALQDGRTLDQLGLRAGDEILVGGERAARQRASLTNVILPAVTGLVSVTWLLVQIF